MAEHAILGNQDRDQSLCIFEEQAVMADAQSEHDIKFAAVRIQQFGLGYRVT